MAFIVKTIDFILFSEIEKFFVVKSHASESLIVLAGLNNEIQGPIRLIGSDCFYPFEMNLDRSS